MESFTSNNLCKRCNAPKVTDWDGLSDEQKYLVERLPDFEELSLTEMRSSSYCTKCWKREIPVTETYA